MWKYILGFAVVGAIAVGIWKADLFPRERDGLHLLLEVQYAELVRERIVALVDDTRIALRRERFGYTGLKARGNKVVFRLTSPENRDATMTLLRDPDRETNVVGTEAGAFEIVLTEDAIEERKRSAVSRSIEIIRRRIEEMGVRKPTIQRQGDDRVLVQLPGIEYSEHVMALLGKTAKLTFHLLDSSVSPQDARSGRVPPGSMVLPSDDRVDAAGKPIPYVVRKRVMVSGDSLVDARPTYQDNQPVLSFRFDTAGAKKFAKVTQANVGKPFAIVLDGKVISVPIIREPILGGSGIISGNFTVESAADLALLLRTGALPVSMKILEVSTIRSDKR